MVDLEDFKYTGTNITAMRMVDPNSEMIQQVLYCPSFAHTRNKQRIDYT